MFSQRFEDSSEHLDAKSESMNSLRMKSQKKLRKNQRELEALLQTQYEIRYFKE